MKKTITKILSIMLSLAVIITGLPVLGIVANAKETYNYSVGDIIEFGSYPQSEVTDSDLISALNSSSKTWISYDYYTGTGYYDDGKMQPSDYMKYADITYDGNKYRAVTFTQYRPYDTGHLSFDSLSYQNDNGYYTDTVYWFKYEPLEWRVLDPDEGFIMCESIIDSQAYNNTIYYDSVYKEWYKNSLCENYANDYATSSIRAWLNNDFYNTAFTDEEKSEIKESMLDNSSDVDAAYDSDATYDKVFLLSFDEMNKGEYGFSSDASECDIARQAQGTDYAKCQGLYSKGGNAWFLRSPSSQSSCMCLVSETGEYFYYYGITDSTYLGVRPALKFNPKSEIVVPDDEYMFYIQYPSQTTIRNKDGIILHAIVDGTAPEGSYVQWIPYNNNFSSEADGNDLLVTAKKNGDTLFIAQLCDADGNLLISDRVVLHSNSGLFQRILGFFRSLFGLTNIYEY